MMKNDVRLYINFILIQYLTVVVTLLQMQTISKSAFHVNLHMFWELSFRESLQDLTFFIYCLIGLQFKMCMCKIKRGVK